MNWKGKAIRIVEQKVYFFNDKEIYTHVSIEEAKRMKLEGLRMDYYKKNYYFSEISRNSNPQVTRAILCLNEGDSIRKFEKDICRFEEIYKIDNYTGYTNIVFRISKGKFYYFNEKGKYSCMSEKEMLSSNIDVGYVSTDGGEGIWYSCASASRHLCKMLNLKNGETFKSALYKMKLGDTVDMIEKYYKESMCEKRRKPHNEVEQFVTKIDKLNFVWKPDNQNKDTTFDYIHINVYIASKWEKDKVAYIKENLKSINSLVLNRLETNRSFLKYGIPISYLKISKVTFCKKSNVLRYVISFKDIA